jgi:endonuclease/exonuclease/phosphatase family metal-dependent hydrolase
MPRARRRLILGAGVALAGLLSATALSTANATGSTSGALTVTQVSTTATASAAASAAKPLRVASYNVRCANCGGGGKNAGSWAQRRGAIVASIRSQHLDVLGVQEASQGRIHDSATGKKNLSQFDDLRARLGGSWRLTNSKRYNCVKHSSPNKCKYKAQGASKGTRILYDSSRIELLAAGSARLPKPGNDTERSVAWAQFRQRSTGKSFMFADLHTTSEDKYHSYKKKQAEKALATLRAHNPKKLPMIAVGDWNSSRFEKPSNAPYDVFAKAGFKDPLGGKYRTTKTAPGATVEKRIRTWVSSSNRYTRKAPAHRNWVNGSYIDYIMTTSMRVSEWETVAHLDKKGNFIGRIPSDHNMIRATVWLPR